MMIMTGLGLDKCMPAGILQGLCHGKDILVPPTREIDDDDGLRRQAWQFPQGACNGMTGFQRGNNALLAH